MKGGHNLTFLLSGRRGDYVPPLPHHLLLKVPSLCERGEEAGFLYATARKGLSLGMSIVYVSVLSAEAAMPPIVPGRVRQASYPNRPCLLQQLWTSPPPPSCSPSPLLLHLLQLLPVLLLLLNINPTAAGLGHKEEEKGELFSQETLPCTDKGT